MELSKSIKKTYLYFMMYAIIGWCYEVFLEVVVYQWGFTNRGVLFGPSCPVYGFGALAFILCFGKIMKKKEPNWFVYVKPLIIFMGCAFVATGIELVASYMLEILTGSWPWQTYADYAINFQARIALSPSIRFGLGGLLFLYILQPIFEKVIYKLGDKKVSILFYAILFPFILDLFVKLFKMVS